MIFIVTSVMVILIGGSLWPKKNITAGNDSGHGNSNMGPPSTKNSTFSFKVFKLWLTIRASNAESHVNEF